MLVVYASRSHGVVWPKMVANMGSPISADMCAPRELGIELIDAQPLLEKAPSLEFNCW